MLANPKPGDPVRIHCVGIAGIPNQYHMQVGTVITGSSKRWHFKNIVRIGGKNIRLPSEAMHMPDAPLPKKDTQTLELF